MPARAWFEEDHERLSDHAAAWQALSDRSLEPNPFYEPWFVLPALRGLKELGRHCGVAFVEESGSLVAAVPLLRRPLARGVPLRRAQLLTHKYSFCHTPLLDAQVARSALTALLEWCRREHTPVLELDQIYADGPFRELIDELGLPSFVRASSDRAFFRPRADADAYLGEAMSSKRRREVLRRERQLQAAGKLTLPELGPNGAGDVGNLDAFRTAFARLEAAGWKGIERTAFASNPDDLAFFDAVVAGGHAAGRVWFQNADLDGKTIASLLSFVSGPASYSWKICHDEALAKLSPGVFIELVNLRRLHERRAIEWMDSGATADHPMLNKLWIDRRVIETRWLSTGGRLASLAIGALPLFKRASQLVRRRGRTTASTSSEADDT